MSVWITRSAPDNLRTARELRALGQHPLMVPVMTTVPRHQPSPGSLPDAIVFTSVHAVRHFAHHDQLSSVPVFAASGPIANAATAAGYRTVTSTGGDEEMLRDLIGHVLPPAARILLLCGDSTSAVTADHLVARGCLVARHAVYRSVPTADDALAPATGALHRIDAIVVHSRKGAERIVPMLRDARWRGALWCISEQAAHACSALHHVSVHTAAQVSERSLLDMIARISPASRKQSRLEQKINADMLMSTLRPPGPSHGLASWNDNAPEPRPGDHPDPGAA